MKKQNSKQRLFEVMSRLDKTFKPKLNENIYKSRDGYLTISEPIIPDAIEAISKHPEAIEFTDKQSFDEFANKQKYFSASYSHCFYSPEEKEEWHRNGSKYNDRDSEQSVMLFNTDHELVQVWDNKNQIGYVVPSKLNNMNEILGFSKKEKQNKANQEKIDAAKQEVAKYNFNRIFFIPAMKDGRYVDIEGSNKVRINGVRQELPMLAELMPNLFDLNQGATSIMMLSSPNRYEGLIPSNWYSYVRSDDGYISGEKAIETLNRELDKKIDSLNNMNEINESTDEYFPITTPIGSEDDKLFVGIVNQGIDSSLEGFTKSDFTVKDTSLGKRRVFNFHTSELPILLRRLEELGTEEALQWKDDIENYDNNINELQEETYSDHLDTNYSADGMDDYHHTQKSREMAEKYYDVGKTIADFINSEYLTYDMYQSLSKSAESLRNYALHIGNSLGWSDNELPPYNIKYNVGD
jgi:hypothetical protein